MKSPNLFGEDQEFTDIKITGKYKTWRVVNRYRRAEVKEKSCRNCEYKFGTQYHIKIYHKCALQGESKSEASDITLRSVCDLYRPRK